MFDFVAYTAELTGIVVQEEQKLAFETYFRRLVAENEKYNLTAITEREDVYEKHFLDSVAGAALLPAHFSVCDLGSGAGFPGLPLKILRPDLQMVLADSLNKRISFCREVAAEIKVELECVHTRAEDFAIEKRATFDAVVSRAVAPLNVLLELDAPLVKVGGIVVAYKTDDSELAASENAARLLGLRLREIKYYVLPSGAKRALLCFKKVHETPLKYPRPQNKPRKNPL